VGDYSSRINTLSFLTTSYKQECIWFILHLSFII
jgi:hypothetical protein